MTRPGDAAQPTPTRIRLPRHRHKTAATKTTRPHQRAAPRPRRSTQHWGQTPQEIAGPKNRHDGHPAMCAHTQWAWLEECLELLPDWPRVELCAVRSAATYPHGHLAAVRNLSTTDRAYGGRRPCSTAESAGGIAGAYGCEGANVVVARYCSRPRLRGHDVLAGAERFIVNWSGRHHDRPRTSVRHAHRPVIHDPVDRRPARSLVLVAAEGAQ